MMHRPFTPNVAAPIKWSTRDTTTPNIVARQRDARRALALYCGLVNTRDTDRAAQESDPTGEIGGRVAIMESRRRRATNRDMLRELDATTKTNGHCSSFRMVLCDTLYCNERFVICHYLDSVIVV